MRFLAVTFILLVSFLASSCSFQATRWPDYTDITLPLPFVGEGNVCGQIDTGELVIIANDLPRGSQYGDNPYPNLRLLFLSPDGRVEEFYRPPEGQVGPNVVTEGYWVVWTVADRMYALNRKLGKTLEIPARLGLMTNLSLSEGKAVWRDDEGADTGHLKMWDLETGAVLELENIPEPTSGYHTLAVYHQGKLFTCTPSSLVLLEVDTGKVLKTFDWKEETWPGTTAFGPWRLYLTDQHLAWIEYGKLAQVNKGGNDQCSRLVVVDLETGEKEILGQGGKEQSEGGNAIIAALTDQFVAWLGWPKEIFSPDPVQSKIYAYIFENQKIISLEGTPGRASPELLDEGTIAWLTLPPTFFESPQPGDSVTLRIVRPMEIRTP
jgi:hypothetical protein